jgi:uncharacterized protein YndB with AHSA1/START domain
MESAMPHQTIVLEVSHCFEFDAGIVFDCWLDEHRAGRWMFATPSGKLQHIEIDARVGGRYRLIEHRNGADVHRTGEYHLIDRPQQLLFSFSTDSNSPEPDLVRILISPLPFGCELTLRHQMSAQWQPDQQKIIEGWTNVLVGLAAELNRSGGANCLD